MPTIHGIQASPAVTDEIRRLVQECDARTLLALWGDDADLQKGFRPGTPAAVDAIRSRLLTRLLGATAIKGRELAFLASCGLNQEWICVWSPEAVARLLPVFLAVLGEAPVLLALLVDEREVVRKLAEPLLAGPAEALPDADTARRAFEQELAPFLRHLARCRAPAEGEAAADSEARNRERGEACERERALRQQAEQLERDLREARKRLGALQRDYDELKADRDKLAGQMDALRQKTKRAEDELARAQQVVAQHTSNLPALVEAEVQVRLSDLAHRWLAAPLQAEQAAAGKAELLDEADALLRRQAEVDRHWGNLQQLDERLRHLEEAAARVAQARQQALNPLPELIAMESRLRFEAERLRGLLRRDGVESPFAAALVARINGASNVELIGLEDLVALVDGAGLLPPRELQRLASALHARWSRLYEPHAPVRQKESEPAAPVGRLYGRLAGAQPVFVALDGFNILQDAAADFGDFFEQGKPGAKARDALNARVKALLEALPQAEARIVYDSPQTGEASLARNIRVLYSGGQGEHRADAAILKDLEFERQARPERPRFVVTNDADLARQARALGATPVSVHPFVGFLTPA